LPSVSMVCFPIPAGHRGLMVPAGRAPPWSVFPFQLATVETWFQLAERLHGLFSHSSWPLQRHGSSWLSASMVCFSIPAGHRGDMVQLAERLHGLFFHSSWPPRTHGSSWMSASMVCFSIPAGHRGDMVQLAERLHGLFFYSSWPPWRHGSAGRASPWFVFPFQLATAETWFQLAERLHGLFFHSSWPPWTHGFSWLSASMVCFSIPAGHCGDMVLAGRASPWSVFPFQLATAETWFQLAERLHGLFFAEKLDSRMQPHCNTLRSLLETDLRFSEKYLML